MKSIKVRVFKYWARLTMINYYRYHSVITVSFRHTPFKRRFFFSMGFYSLIVVEINHSTTSNVAHYGLYGYTPSI